MEDYKEKYEMALEGIQEILSSGQDSIKMPQLQLRLQGIFPELTESEDEKTRKSIICGMNALKEQGKETFATIPIDDAIAWLEKQESVGEIVERCKSSWYNEGKIAGMAEGLTNDEKYQQGWHDALEKQVPEPNWCHHKVDLSNCSEEYRKAYYDGWNNCNMQHSQCKSELNDVIKCLINGMRFYYEDNKDATWGTDKWSMPVKHIIDVLEKQGEQKPILDFKARNWYVSKVDGKIHDITYNSTDKVESKFKVGDYIVSDYCMGRVIEITNDAYLLDTGQGIPFSCENKVHLWTIADANEGNILAGKIDGDNYILIFKTIKDGWIETYGHYYNAVNRFCVPSQLFCRSYQGTFTPATKEQRELLFKKMNEAGYEWDADKKELKLLITNGGDFEPKQEWSEKDEKMYRMCVDAVEYYHTPEDESIVRDWLKSLKDRLSNVKKH